MNVVKTRDSYFDNVKFFLITTVVVGHTIEYATGIDAFETLYKFLYFFHMPLFIFITGYFSKNINSEKYAQNMLKLLVPYLIFETLYSIADYFILEKDELIFSYLIPYWIMWYLLCVAIWKIILPYIIKIKYALPVFFIVGILAGYMDEAGYLLSIQRVLAFFPYFLLGYYFDKKYLEKMFNWKNRIIALVILVFSIILIYFYRENIEIQWLQGAFSYSSFEHTEWYAGIYRVLTYCISIILSVCVLVLTPRRKLWFISEAGTRTLYVYLWHGFIVLYLKFKTELFVYSNINDVWEQIRLVLIGIFITFVLSLRFIETFTKPIISPKLDRFFK